MCCVTTHNARFTTKKKLTIRVRTYTQLWSREIWAAVCGGRASQPLILIPRTNGERVSFVLLSLVFSRSLVSASSRDVDDVDAEKKKIKSISFFPRASSSIFLCLCLSLIDVTTDGKSKARA